MSNQIKRLHRVLITQSTLERIGGSEVQAYELATYLHNQNIDVTLYSWFADAPMLTLLQEKGFSVITRDNENDYSLQADNFDLVWVQHNVLPREIITSYNDALEKGHTPFFIFSHMSPLSELHIEFPYIHDMETVISDLSVFNSPGTLEAQRSWYPKKYNRLAVYPNPAPSEFSRYKTKYNPTLSSVLVVSNHPPRVE